MRNRRLHYFQRLSVLSSLQKVLLLLLSCLHVHATENRLVTARSVKSSLNKQTQHHRCRREMPLMTWSMKRLVSYCMEH